MHHRWLFDYTINESRTPPAGSADDRISLPPELYIGICTCCDDAGYPELLVSIIHICVSRILGDGYGIPCHSVDNIKCR